MIGTYPKGIGAYLDGGNKGAQGRPISYPLRAFASSAAANALLPLYKRFDDYKCLAPSLFFNLLRGTLQIRGCQRGAWPLNEAPGHVDCKCGC